VLSSHLLPDLERLCDHLIVLSSSRVQVLGSVEDLLAEHKVLVGPRRDGWEGGGLGTIVQEQHTERQTTVLVRTSGPVSDPSWVVHDVSLEELVLAYLGHPEAGALPGPDRAIDGGATR
jgi:ABC-2 type transport system ATP-binding protein